MSDSNEKEYESLADRLINLMGKIREAREQLNEIEEQSANLLRKMLNRNGSDKR